MTIRIELVTGAGANLVVKSKSMLSEEIEINERLGEAAVEVVETDLGEWIVQLAHETPSHIILPAIHKQRRGIQALFEAERIRPERRGPNWTAAMVAAIVAVIGFVGFTVVKGGDSGDDSKTQVAEGSTPTARSSGATATAPSTTTAPSPRCGRPTRCSPSW